MALKKSKKTRKRRKLAAETRPNIDEKTMNIFAQKGYQILEMLGSGSFGEVFKAYNSIQQVISAVKIIDLKLCSEKYKKKFLPRELAAMIETNHENIVKTYDIFRSNNQIYIFMEFASNGDMSKYLKKNGSLDEEKSRIWFFQTTDAVNYLHEEMYTAHRDIKIENILFNDDWVVKLADFGFATEAIDLNGNIILSETFCGTLPYYCPQILEHREYNPFLADVWALGVTLFAMIHNKYPFHFKSHDKKYMLKEILDVSYLPKRYDLIKFILFVNLKWKIFLQNIISKYYFRISSNCSEELRDLLIKMFEINEDERITVKEILVHSWIVNSKIYPNITNRKYSYEWRIVED